MRVKVLDKSPAFDELVIGKIYTLKECSPETFAECYQYVDFPDYIFHKKSAYARTFVKFMKSCINE